MTPLQLRTKKQLLTRHLNYENRKHAIELVPLNSYNKGLACLLTKTLKDIKNHPLSEQRYFHNSLSHLKPILYFIPMIPSILE